MKKRNNFNIEKVCRDNKTIGRYVLVISLQFLLKLCEINIEGYELSNEHSVSIKNNNRNSITDKSVKSTEYDRDSTRDSNISQLKKISVITGVSVGVAILFFTLLIIYYSLKKGFCVYK